MKRAAVDQKIETVEADETGERRETLHDRGQRMSEFRRKRRRPHRAAVPKWICGTGVGPLRAQAEKQSTTAIAEDERRDWIADNAALIVERGITLPWRGRVGARSAPGWGEQHVRLLVFKRGHPHPTAFGGRPPPSRG